jgi:hypothetical protein
MRLAIAVVFCAALLGAAAGAGAVQPPPDAQSWADGRHGWGVANNRLYATEDAGKTWRLIFGHSTFSGFMRISTTTGIIDTGDGPPSESWWTNDNGRRWFRTMKLPGFIDFRGATAGRGSHLFWSWDTRLYQVLSWPPRGLYARCRHKMAKEPQIAPGPLCEAPTRELRTKLVASFRDGRIVALDDAPGGVVAVVARPEGQSTGPLVRVLVRRLGANRIGSPSVPSPEPELHDPYHPAFGGLRLLVKWPVIWLTGYTRTNVILWSSQNGGRTWTRAP